MLELIDSNASFIESIELAGLVKAQKDIAGVASVTNHHHDLSESNNYMCSFTFYYCLMITMFTITNHLSDQVL